ncbi:MAG: hypothetical protein ACOCTP_04235 [Roseicyclus sp.]
MMRFHARPMASLGRAARAACLLGALALVAACGADGEPERPTRGDATPSALIAR